MWKNQGPGTGVLLTGAETFTSGGWRVGAQVIDLWRWRSSGLVEGRGSERLASFLVGAAIKSPGTPSHVPAEYDFTEARAKPIEVRAQVLQGPDEDVDPSTVELWCPPTDDFRAFREDEPSRKPHLYVFAVLTARSGGTPQPLELTNWDFYVVPTGFLNEHWPASKFIALADLRPTQYGEPVPYGALAHAIFERGRHYPVRPARSAVQTNAIETDAALFLAHADALGLDFRAESLRGWNHMGAVVIDMALVYCHPHTEYVRPRVLKMKHEWPDAVSISGLLRRLASADVAALLDLDDEAGVRRIHVLAQLLRQMNIETVDDLRAFVTNPQTRESIYIYLAPAYPGNVPSNGRFGMAVGTTGYLVTEELRAFMDDAGIVHRMHPHPTQVAEAAALSRGVPVKSMYSAIWAYDDEAKA